MGNLVFGAHLSHPVSCSSMAELFPGFSLVSAARARQRPCFFRFRVVIAWSFSLETFSMSLDLADRGPADIETQA